MGKSSHNGKVEESTTLTDQTQQSITKGQKMPLTNSKPIVLIMRAEGQSFAAFIGKKDYNYDSTSRELANTEGASLRRNANNFRSEATRLLTEELDIRRFAARPAREATIQTAELRQDDLKRAERERLESAYIFPELIICRSTRRDSLSSAH